MAAPALHPSLQAIIDFELDGGTQVGLAAIIEKAAKAPDVTHVDVLSAVYILLSTHPEKDDVYKIMPGESKGGVYKALALAYPRETLDVGFTKITKGGGGKKPYNSEFTEKIDAFIAGMPAVIDEAKRAAQQEALTAAMREAINHPTNQASAAAAASAAASSQPAPPPQTEEPATEEKKKTKKKNEDDDDTKSDASGTTTRTTRSALAKGAGALLGWLSGGKPDPARTPSPVHTPPRVPSPPRVSSSSSSSARPPSPIRAAYPDPPLPNREAERLLKEKELLEQALTDARQQLEDASKEVITRRAERDILEAKTNALAIERDTFKEKADDASHKVGIQLGAISSLNEEKKELEARLRSMTGVSPAVVQERDRLKSDLSLLEARRIALESERDALKGVASTSANEAKLQREAATKLVEEKNALDTKVLTLANDQLKLLSERDRLREELATFRSSSSVSAASTATINSLNAKIEAKERELANNNDRNTALSRRIAEVEAQSEKRRISTKLWKGASGVAGNLMNVANAYNTQVTNSDLINAKAMYVASLQALLDKRTGKMASQRVQVIQKLIQMERDRAITTIEELLSAAPSAASVASRKKKKTKGASMAIVAMVLAY